MLTLDEEVDFSEFQRYLSEQDDEDLTEIYVHLDPYSVPRRCEAVRREIVKRHVLVAPVYTLSESFWRYLSLVTILIALVTTVLAAVISPAEAVAPQPLPCVGITSALDPFVSGSEGDVPEENANVTWLIAGQMAENSLRDVVYDFSFAGIYALLFGVTLSQIVLLIIERPKNSGRAYVRKELLILLTLAFLVQTVMIGATGAGNMPILLHNGALLHGGYAFRSASLLAPWG